MNLYACGEVTSTGLHGANRLGSNSLLEGLVFGKVAGQQILADLARDEARPDPDRIRHEVRESTRGELNIGDVWNSLRAVTWRRVGIVRCREDLEEADGLIEFWQSYVLDKVFENPFGWELQNMLTVGRLMTRAALLRTETRGVHYRSDFPDRDDANWRKHIIVQRDRDVRIE